MITIEDVITETSKQLNIDREIVNVICKHPFLFTVAVMKDSTDTHDVLFNKLFRFSLKGRFKSDKTKPYSPKL